MMKRLPFAEAARRMRCKDEGGRKMFEQGFDARVIDGQLIPTEPLRAFEGKEVRVTLSVPAESTRAAIDESSDVQPPDNFDVEKDIYVRMPFRSVVVHHPPLVNGGALKPCLILPEDLPND